MVQKEGYWKIPFHSTGKFLHYKKQISEKIEKPGVHQQEYDSPLKIDLLLILIIV